MIGSALMTVRVIPSFDVGEEFALYVAVIVEPGSVEQIAFEGGEEALGLLGSRLISLLSEIVS